MASRDNNMSVRTCCRSSLRRWILLLMAALMEPSAVEAYITSGLPAHTHRAFLQKMTDDICRAAPGSLSPEEVDNAPMLMSAWADAPEKLKLSSGKHGKERALAVEGLLKRMIDERRAGNSNAVVKTEDYNAVMKSWVMSGEKSSAALRVEEILMNMQAMYSSGDKDVQPSSESFKLAIEAWTKATDEKSAPRRAHKIIEWMSNIYLSSANELAAPDTSCFYPVLKAWANSGELEAPIMSEHLIMWMQHLQNQGVESAKPDTSCFNVLMSTWLKSGDITAEKRIRQVFEYMELSCRRGNNDIKPNSGTYNIAISSIGPAVKNADDSGAARRADKILARLENGFIAGDESLRPDTIIYNQVIDYWAKTQSVHGHFLKARSVLDRQIDMYQGGVVQKCRPDVTSYTSVIGACASTFGSWKVKRRAFDLAHKTLMESCSTKHTAPNDVTYGLMFKAVGRLLQHKEERDRYGRTLFDLCSDEGYLGEMTFNRMKGAVSEELFLELTNGISRYNEIPLELRCNAKAPHRQFCEGKDKRKQKKKLNP